MKDIQIFNNPEFGELRTIEEGDKIYFVATDAARMLGYAKPSNAVSAHCKGALKRGIPTSGGVQQMNVIPEGDLYRLIVNSELPSAEKFESWVFDEVLPAIRKTGGYSVKQAAARDSYMIEDPIARAQAWICERQQYNDAITEVEKSKQIIGELKPKADYTDRILNSKSLVSITQIAKDYGMSGKAMNGKLHELGIIYKLGSQWLLYSRYQAKGYTHSETVDITHSDGRADVVMNTKWTQKGRLFLYQHLKKHGILPVIEQDQQPVLTIVG